MPLEGPLQDIGIHDVFQLLDLTRKSGRLTVRSMARGNEGRVCFQSGAVVHATMRHNPHAIGTLLEKAGKISSDDLRRASLAQRNGDSRRLGELLVAAGAVTRHDVERYVRLQIERVVFDLFSWQEGTFTFVDGGVDDLELDAGVRVSTESLLMEAARRIDEWSRMADRIPGADVVPRLAPPRRSDSFIELRPAEWEVLSLIDGRRTLMEIASELAVTEFDVAKAVYGMLRTDLIEVDSPRGAAA